MSMKIGIFCRYSHVYQVKQYTALSKHPNQIVKLRLCFDMLKTRNKSTYKSPHWFRILFKDGASTSTIVKINQSESINYIN